MSTTPRAFTVSLLRCRERRGEVTTTAALLQRCRDGEVLYASPYVKPTGESESNYHLEDSGTPVEPQLAEALIRSGELVLVTDCLSPLFDPSQVWAIPARRKGRKR
jgi:hypothetical protein